MIAICMLVGFVPATSYATENTDITNKEFKLSELITDTQVDENWVWESGKEIPLGAKIINDTDLDLELIFSGESISSLPTGTSPEVIAAGAGKTLAATEGSVTTLGQWKVCGNRKGGTYGEASATVKYAVVLYPTSVTPEVSVTPSISSVTPKEATYGYGEGEAYVSVAVSNVTGYTYTYQWFSNNTLTNNGGTAISGATSSIYSLPIGKNAGEYYFYCVVTASGNGQSIILTSDAIAVTIKKAAMQVEAKDATNKHDGTSAYGITVNVKIPANGYVIKYGETEGNYALSDSPKYKELGSKKVYYQITDSNGNYETYTGEATVSIVDATAPTGSITAAGKTSSGFISSVTFGTPVAAPQKVTITSSDNGSGEGEIYYYVSQSALTSTQIQGESISWKTYKGAFELEEEKKYVVYAKLTDQAGNIRYISSYGFTLDDTEPAISGISDGGEYCQSKSVTVTDTNLSKVMVDSSSKTVSSGKSTFTLSGDADGKEYTITATDAAGNETEYTVTIYSSHTYSDFKQTESDGIWSVETASCEHGCGKSYKRYRKYTDIMAEEDPSGGSIAMNVEVRTGVPAVSVKGLDTEVAKKMVTDAATQAAKGTNVLVYLDITRPGSVPAADKTATENAVKQSGVSNLKEGMYLDMSMYKKVGTTAATKFTKVELNKKLTFTVAVPEALKAPAGTTRNYYVVRVHNGTATMLNTTFKDNEITFETDRFSTYSIWYTENGNVAAADKTTTDGTATTKATVSGGNQGTNSADSTKDSVPKTGDEDMSSWYGILCLAGAVGMIYFGKKKVLK